MGHYRYPEERVVAKGGMGRQVNLNKVSTSHVHRVVKRTPTYPQGEHKASNGSVVHPTEGGNPVRPSICKRRCLRNVTNIRHQSLRVPTTLRQGLSVLTKTSEGKGIALRKFVGRLISQRLRRCERAASVVLRRSLPNPIVGTHPP